MFHFAGSLKRLFQRTALKVTEFREKFAFDHKLLIKQEFLSEESSQRTSLREASLAFKPKEFLGP